MCWFSKYSHYNGFYFQVYEKTLALFACYITLQICYIRRKHISKHFQQIELGCLSEVLDLDFL